MAQEATIRPQVFEPGVKPAPLDDLQKEILELKREKNAVILAHNYQIEPIQRIADFLGDSLGLSYQAAGTKADVILFCGVHFMAETAKILSPDKTVILPDLNAGCSLADSCRAEKLREYKEKNPGLYVVAYINCSAAVKALSDVICTSGNAEKIVNHVPADREILFVPDQNLGQWVMHKTGRKMRLWPGSCYVHVMFSAKQLAELKTAFPNAPVMAHPECVSSVRDMADLVCSTEKMISFSKETKSDTIIVATETGMIHRLQKEVPGKRFVAGPTPVCACNECRYMKLNTLEKVRDALKNLSPRIDLESDIIEKAAPPIRRMLEWSK
jgi:quinolinate synthase